MDLPGKHDVGATICRAELQDGRLFDRAPKSASGVRSVSFPAELLDAVTHHRAGLGGNSSLPHLNAAQAAHPAYTRSLEALREMNVMIDTYEPHRPKAGGGADRFRWEEALDLLEPRLGRRA